MRKNSIKNTRIKKSLFLPIYLRILVNVFLAFLGFLKSFLLPGGPIGGIIQALLSAVYYKFPDKFHWFS